MKNRILSMSLCMLAVAPALSHAQAKPKEAKKKPKTEQVAPAPPPVRKSLGESLTEPAKGDYDTAVALYKQGAFSQSAAKFVQAYESSKDARLLWNAAAAEKQQRHYAKARVLVRQYVTLGTDLTEKDKTDASELLAVLDRLVSNVTIRVNEPGAAIAVDGEQVGESPLPKAVTLDTGTRSIRVTKDNFLPYQAAVPIGVGATAVVDVKLLPHIKDGRIAIRTSEADSSISIDSKAVGRGTYSGIVASGAHQLYVSKDGYKPYDLSFTIAENSSRSFDVTLERTKRRVPVWAIVAGSVLVAGIATAVIAIAATPETKNGVPNGTFFPYKVTLNAF